MASLRTWIEIGILVIFFLALQWFLMGFAKADDSPGSYIIETIQDAISDVLGSENETQEVAIIPYIYQGDVVYMNTTIDVSGVVPPYPMLAYWDGYDMYDSPPTYNYTMGDRKNDYYKFYVDPEIFSTRPGRWYKYDGKYENRGNNLAFVVSPYKYSNFTVRFPNGTLINVSEAASLIQYEQRPKIPEPPLLEERHESDYIIAKGDEANWSWYGKPNQTFKVWVFGRVNGIYSHNSSVLSAKEIEGLESGEYTVGLHYPGNNTIYESTYRSDMLYPGLYGKDRVNTVGLSPRLILEQVRGMLKGTDDTFQEYHMVVDTPYITIRQVDEATTDNHAVLDVRGYTNAANGTKITVVLDERGSEKYSGTGLAVRTSPGNLSYYRVYIPFAWDDIAADARNHTLVARTALGGQTEKDFKVSLMPADSYRPNASLKYIEGRNPFVPTPTPIVVTQVVTQEIVRFVTVPVTPSNEQVYEQQKKAEDRKWGELYTNVGYLIAGVIAAFAGFFVVKYLHGLYKRKKECESDGKP